MSPFLSERARKRAPQILSYAAVGGVAVLVSPRGEIVMVSGAATEVDLEGVARRVSGLASANGHRSFKVGNACVHALPVTMGWVLCVMSTLGVHPGPIVERLRRAGAVMAMALMDGAAPSSSGGGSGSGGAPAEVALAPKHRAN